MAFKKVNPKDVKVPHARWGGRWLRPLTDIAAQEPDGNFYVLTPYKKTTAYQVARELNMLSQLPAGEFVFGVVETAGGSELVVQRVA